MPQPSQKTKVAYTVVERTGRKFWLRLGLAFVNRDGSLSVRLDALPVSGQLVIRDHPAGGTPPQEGTGGEEDPRSLEGDRDA